MVLRLHLLVSQVFHFAIFFFFSGDEHCFRQKLDDFAHFAFASITFRSMNLIAVCFFILFRNTKHFIELNKSYITHILLAEWELVVVLIIPKKTATTILGRKCIENKQMSSALHFFKLKKNNVSTKKIAINVLLSNFFYLINLFSCWNAEWEK
jgi:hypothetical protein